MEESLNLDIYKISTFGPRVKNDPCALLPGGLCAKRHVYAIRIRHDLAAVPGGNDVNAPEPP